MLEIFILLPQLQYFVSIQCVIELIERLHFKLRSIYFI